MIPNGSFLILSPNVVTFLKIVQTCITVTAGETCITSQYCTQLEMLRQIRMGYNLFNKINHFIHLNYIYDPFVLM
jgi:energy-converting hydrogenase Eha subunit H